MRICIYPGSFDPITNGHLDIIKRASELFDTVIVTVMVNSSKNPIFSLSDRVNLISKCISDFSNIRVEYAENQLLAEYAKQKNATAIIKGLRAVSDFEYEFQQALMNKTLNNDIETVFLITSLENMFLSSSSVKEICKLGGDIRGFIPEVIHDEVVTRLHPSDGGDTK